MEQLNDFFGKLFAYLREHPQYGLLVAILLVILYLVGLILTGNGRCCRAGTATLRKCGLTCLAGMPSGS